MALATDQPGWPQLAYRLTYMPPEPAGERCSGRSDQAIYRMALQLLLSWMSGAMNAAEPSLGAAADVAVVDLVPQVGFSEWS